MVHLAKVERRIRGRPYRWSADLVLWLCVFPKTNISIDPLALEA